MQSRGVKIAVLVAVAIAAAWTRPAPAAHPRLLSNVVAGTVSCATSAGALQLNAIAYRPSWGYAAALVQTGAANTPATITLVGVRTDRQSYIVDGRCSKTKKSVRFTHHGLALSSVVKRGYNQSPMVYCGAPSHVLVRYRMTFNSGKPATATLVAWAKRKHSSRLHEIGYVKWSPNRSTTYYSRKSCTSE